MSTTYRLHLILLAGYFLHAVNAACGAGKYTSGSGCASCAPGTYQSDNQNPQSSCTPAQAGFYAPGTGATSQLPCQPGTFSTGGTAACTICPAGHKCPGTQQTQAQPCSPGQYQPSTGSSASSCPVCPVGTYNWINGATACCRCCAGTFNNQVSQTHCYSCTQQTSSSTPYSPVGATSKSQCVGSVIPGVSNNPDACTNTPSSTQNPAPGTATCPAEQGSGPQPSAIVNRRSVETTCIKGYMRCPSYSGRGGLECVDIANDPESCGGCVAPESLMGISTTSPPGQDCTEIPSVNVVQCVRGGCVVQCRRGFRRSSDGRSCTPVLHSRSKK